MPQKYIKWLLLLVHKRGAYAYVDFALDNDGHYPWRSPFVNDVNALNDGGGLGVDHVHPP